MELPTSYNPKGFNEKVPHIWDFFHYSSRAHSAFFTENWEGICTFGLSKNTWLRIWKLILKAKIYL